jgi:hypothetical protein
MYLLNTIRGAELSSEAEEIPCRQDERRVGGPDGWRTFTARRNERGSCEYRKVVLKAVVER